MDSSDLIPIEWLQKAFDRLPDELREPLTLVRAEELSYEEAGERLGIPVIEVEHRIAHTLARLAYELERMKWQEWRRW